MTREEAISLLMQVNKILVNSNSWLENTHEPLNIAFDMAIKALEQQPKTGHWIATGDYFTGAYSSIDYVKCSCCGYESLEEGNYCPNCGTRMKESEEKE